MGSAWKGKTQAWLSGSLPPISAVPVEGGAEQEKLFKPDSAEAHSQTLLMCSGSLNSEYHCFQVNHIQLLYLVAGPLGYIRKYLVRMDCWSTGTCYCSVTLLLISVGDAEISWPFAWLRLLSGTWSSVAKPGLLLASCVGQWPTPGFHSGCLPGSASTWVRFGTASLRSVGQRSAVSSPSVPLCFAQCLLPVPC